MTERPGIVHLNDLAHRYVWEARAIAPFIAALELVIDPQPAWRAFTPPRALVLIVKHDEVERLERARTWRLASAPCSAARVTCLDPDAEAVVEDAIREGRHEAVAALRREHPTRTITDELEVLAIPGTRNILEIAAGVLRVV